MNDFYARLPIDEALRIERLGRLSYDLRERRRAVLARHGVDDEAALLARAGGAEDGGDAACEDYYHALSLAERRRAVRHELEALLRETSRRA